MGLILLVCFAVRELKCLILIIDYCAPLLTVLCFITIQHQFSAFCACRIILLCSSHYSTVHCAA